MDGSRFDQFARALAHRPTRRAFVSGLAAAAVGVIGARNAATACLPDQYAGSSGRCLCKLTGRPAGPNGCPCPTGLTNCDGICVDTATDSAHCGACGAVCPVLPRSTATCTDGACGVVCDSGTVRLGDTCCPAANVCGESCLETPCNSDACEVCDPGRGTCARACVGAEICVGGQCICPDGAYVENGGCFTTCESGFCGSCATCMCDFSRDTFTDVCVDRDTYLGVCNRNADCPPGSICNILISGSGGHLCTRPCPCPD